MLEKKEKIIEHQMRQGKTNADDTSQWNHQERIP
jgi:hypothetical protein